MVNYYSVLGVKADADAASIRTAYLTLIKQVHPDLPSGSDIQSDRHARELNEAYWILKDDRRRRAYDAQLRRANWESARRRLAPFSTNVPLPRAEPARRRFWPTALILLPAVAVASGVLVGSAPQIQRKSIIWSPEAIALAEVHRLEPDRNVWVDPVMVERAVENASDIAGEAGGDALLRYSRNCFGQLRTNPNPLRAEHCIAFDLAAASIAAIKKSPVHTEFTVPGLARKHRAALRMISAEESSTENWLRAISEATISEMARQGERTAFSAPFPQ